MSVARLEFQNSPCPTIPSKRRYSCLSGHRELSRFVLLEFLSNRKGLTTKQLEDLKCDIILGNTYHLGHRPGGDLLEKMGGLHQFMNWRRNMLTDSGGFQIVSLSKLNKVFSTKMSFRRLGHLLCLTNLLHRSPKKECSLSRRTTTRR